jgi:hypothetical protein
MLNFKIMSSFTVTMFHGIAKKKEETTNDIGCHEQASLPARYHCWFVSTTTLTNEDSDGNLYVLQQTAAGDVFQNILTWKNGKKVFFFPNS